MNFLLQNWAALQAIWQGLSRVRRLGVIALALLMLSGGGVYVYFAMPGEYKSLISGLPAEDVAAISSKLTSQNIPYRLNSSGTGVMVPEERLAQARVALAGDGIASRGGKGMELFDESSLGMTPFVQNVNYNRALQAELARSIMQLDPVAAARVIIVRPETTPFIRDQRPATASVVLKLKIGASLSRSTAASIVSLVARSVEGMKPENVALVDSAGRMLSDQRSGEPESVAAGQMEQRRDLETYLATKAEEILARHLGPGRAVVKVSADISFQRVKERRETYSPEDKVVVSERLVSSKSGGGGGGGARGAAGATANLTRTATTGGSGGGSNQEETTQTDYVVSKSVRELEDRLGGIQRLTVAAMVDLQGDGENKPSLQLPDVQDLIKQAIGYRNGRDEIKVTDVKLAGALPLADVADDAVQLQRVTLFVNLARYIALAVGLLTLLATVVLLLRRRKPTITDPADTTIRSGAVPASSLGDGDQRRLIELAERDPDYLVRMLDKMLGGATRV